ncbi:hypothetical protein ABH920_006633 [Catenulispora sp. EB89]|uniref:hypothetical protein n=1 Tax=Catenulispora sp. EB89 TaxID=3156257 RepID=UPI00351443E3
MAVLATGCSSSAGSKPHSSAESHSSAGSASSAGSQGGGKPTAATALAAAPGAVKAAKTMTLDETGTSNGQTAHITGKFDYSGTFKGQMSLTVTGGTPTTPGSGFPAKSDTLVNGDQGFEPVDQDKAPTVGAALVKALNGRHWAQFPVPDSIPAATILQKYLVGGLAAASDDYLYNALAALLSSGVLVPDTAPQTGGTFHYTGTLDDPALKTAKFTNTQLQGITDDMTTRNIMAEKIEVWLAPSGLPTELKFSETSSNTSYGDPPVSGDVHFTWGQPVTVSVPAASDVASQAEVDKALTALSAQTS